MSMNTRRINFSEQYLKVNLAKIPREIYGIILMNRTLKSKELFSVNFSQKDGQTLLSRQRMKLPRLCMTEICQLCRNNLKDFSLVKIVRMIILDTCETLNLKIMSMMRFSRKCQKKCLCVNTEILLKKRLTHTQS